MARPDDPASRIAPAEDAHLMLEGMDTPIHTQITRRSERGMTVEQPLPFLQLRTMVQDQSARCARIESVSMLVCDGMPRLVLDLAYEPDAEADTEPAAQHADGSMEPIDEPGMPPRMVRARRDPTRSFEQPLQTTPGLQAPQVEPESEPELPAGRESTLVFDTVPPPAGEPRVAPDQSIDEMVERMQADRLGPRLVRGWQTAKPHLRHAAILVAAFVMRTARRSYPHLQRAGAATRSGALRGVQAMRDMRAARAQRAAAKQASQV